LPPATRRPRRSWPAGWPRRVIGRTS
jgi:hypothetical protein